MPCDVFVSVLVYDRVIVTLAFKTTMRKELAVDAIFEGTMLPKVGVAAARESGMEERLDVRRVLELLAVSAFQAWRQTK